MSNSIENFLHTINYLNESIEILIEGVIVTPPDGVITVTEKFTVIEDGKTPPNDGGNYISLKDAKAYQADVEVGDEIEIEVIDFEKMDDASIQNKLTELFTKGDISFKDLEQMTLTAMSGKIRRTAMGLVRMGPKLMAVAGRVATLQGIKKTIPHSSCYCAKLFEDNVDTSTGKAERHIYEDDLRPYIDVVKKQFLDSWDQCASRYKKIRDNADDRDDMLASCVSFEDWYHDADQVLNKVMSRLSKYYNITGIEVKDKKLKGGDMSVAKSISNAGSEITLHLTSPIPDPGGGPDLYNTGSHKFKILTYKESGNTIKLKDGRKILYFEFQSPKKKKSQGGSVWEDDGHGNPVSSTAVSWKGSIESYD